ncbi:MAG TPA: vWA domain-containing protein [Pseudobacteroides sp.]|uniref:vWA domain-containing protein n=1 Tax=Pseudobacteroides sp. TaxID=1968840 RepID=UPI002F957BB0
MGRKGIAVLLTAVLTAGLNFLPASAAVVQSPVLNRTVDFKAGDGGNKVEVNQKRNITFNQDSGFTINNPAVNDKEIVFLFDTSGSLNERPTPKPDPFDFALFSGGNEEAFNIQGDRQIINGKIHANGDVVIRGNNHSVTNNGSKVNTIEYVRSVVDGGTIVDGKLVPNTGTIIDKDDKISTDSFVKSPWIEMMDLADDLTDPTKQSVFNRTKDFYFGDYRSMPYINDSRPAYKDLKELNKETKIGERDGKFYIEGTLTIPDNMILRFHDRPVWLSKDLIFQGKGILIAGGDVIIQGGKVITPPVGPDDQVDSMIYSEKGSIRLETNLSTFNGKLYAPEGDIVLQGSDVTVNGSVVAKRLNSIQSKLTVNYKTGAIDEVVDEITKLPTPAETMMAEIEKFVANYPLSGTATRVNVVKYDFNGNDTDNKLYNIATEAGKVALYSKMNNIKFDDILGKSNLGDGLRKAYHLLTKSNSIASKSIIVISGSVPNRYTVDNKGVNYKGAIDLTNSDNFVDDPDPKKPSEYAIEIGKMATESSIVPYFINYLPKEHDNWLSVNTALSNIAAKINDETVPIIKKLKKEFEKANPGSTFSLYSSEPVNESELSTIIDNVLEQLENSYSVKILSAKFEFKLPKGAKLLNDSKLPSGFKSTKNADGTQTITGDIMTSSQAPVIVNGTGDTITNKVTYVIPDNLLFNDKKITDIKFVLVDKLGKGQNYKPVTFLAGDCKVEYEIEYSGYETGIGGEKTRAVIPDKVISTTITPFTVNVYMKIDQN